MTDKVIIGLMILVLLTGIVSAVCEKEKEKLDVSMNGYNLNGIPFMGYYNKTGDKGNACSANVQINNVFSAYRKLSTCYYKAGNRSAALELLDKVEEWGGKELEWDNKCYPDPDGNRADLYDSLSEFYKAINMSEKSCYYCKENNKYTKIAKITCKYYGCPPDDSGSSNPSSDVGGNGGGSGFPVVPVAIGGLIVLILIVAFFLLKGKRNKVK